MHSLTACGPSLSSRIIPIHTRCTYVLYCTAPSPTAAIRLYDDDDDYGDGVVRNFARVNLTVVSRFTVYKYVPNYFSRPITSFKSSRVPCKHIVMFLRDDNIIILSIVSYRSFISFSIPKGFVITRYSA